MISYVFENGFAIGYMNGGRFVRFLTPIKTEMLID
jgi:hypothetical protein